MRKLLLAVMMLVSSNYLKAQQDVMVSQYMFNGLLINPGYTGTHPYLTATAMHRDQWVKFDGAPKTSSLAVDAPLLNDKMGLGLLLVRDQIGVTEQTDVFANYSYKIQAGKGKLSLGLKAGASQYCAKLSKLIVWDENDQVFNSDKSTCWVPKFGFGAYYYTKKLYAGFSMPTLIAYDPNNKFRFDPEKSASLRKHYYLNAGYVIAINEIIKIKPSFLIKYVKAAPVQADLNIHTLIHDIIWLGASYRTGDAIVAMAEYQLTKNLRVGYSYDFTTSVMNKFSRGTHEFMLGYDFLSAEKMKIKTPRFF